MELKKRTLITTDKRIQFFFDTKELVETIAAHPTIKAARCNSQTQNITIQVRECGDDWSGETLILGIDAQLEVVLTQHTEERVDG